MFWPPTATCIRTLKNSCNPYRAKATQPDRGRLEGKPDMSFKYRFILLFAIACAGAQPFHGAQAQDEVEVNTTTLRDLPTPARNDTHLKPVHLKPPADLDAGQTDAGQSENSPSLTASSPPASAREASEISGPMLTGPAPISPMQPHILAPAPVPLMAQLPATPKPYSAQPAPAAYSSRLTTALPNPPPKPPAAQAKNTFVPVAVFSSATSAPPPPVPLRAPDHMKPGDDKMERPATLSEPPDDDLPPAEARRPQLFLPTEGRLSSAGETVPATTTAPQPAGRDLQPQPVPAAEAAPPPFPKAKKTSASISARPAPPAAFAKTAVAPPDDEIVQFPIMTKTRSESPDPSLPASSELPPPLAEQAAKTHAGEKSTAEVPIASPVLAEMSKQMAHSSVNTKQPSPPVHSPEQPAPAKMAAAPADEQENPVPPDQVFKTHTLAEAPRLIAPASPKRTVATIRPDTAPPDISVPDEALMDNMLQMQKGQVMAGIEDTVKRTQPGNGKPVASFGRPQKNGLTVIQAERFHSHNAIITPDDSTSAPAELKPETEAKAETGDEIPALPPAGDEKNPGYVSIVYQPADIGLGAPLQAEIKDKVLPVLLKDPRTHLQIQAFASDGRETHTSRQRSLARALAVREYLLSQGIEAGRLDIRAQGMQSDREPLDRVDFVFLPQADRNSTL
jgi:hypothetical protein